MCAFLFAIVQAIPKQAKVETWDVDLGERRVLTSKQVKTHHQGDFMDKGLRCIIHEVAEDWNLRHKKMVVD